MIKRSRLEVFVKPMILEMRKGSDPLMKWCMKKGRIKAGKFFFQIQLELQEIQETWVLSIKMEEGFMMTN